MRPLALLTLLAVLLTSFGSDAEAAPRRKKRTATGTLQLRSTTDGAVVYVDGKEVGVIPLAEPIPLKAGKHTLKMNKLGYTEYLDVFTITPGQVTDLDLDLLPYAGVLIITSSVEGARVFIDGKFEGVTPLEKEALIGKRSIRVSKAGYYDFFANVKAVAGKTRRITARLKMLPIGSTPYRPKPLPPPKWYERWYVWAGIAGGVAAVTLAIVLPVTMRGGDQVADWGPEKTVHVGTGK